jgi:hypothetical protein
MMEILQRLALCPMFILPAFVNVTWHCEGTENCCGMSVATQNRPVLATSKPATREGLRLKRR